MARTLDIIAMVTRLVLAGLIGGWIVRYKLGEEAGLIIDAPDTLPFLDTALVILLVVCAAWLVLGIRSRVVALIATVLVLVQSTVLHGTALLMAPTEAIAMVLLTVVLLIEGGGRLALYHRGWREIV